MFWFIVLQTAWNGRFGSVSLVLSAEEDIPDAVAAAPKGTKQSQRCLTVRNSRAGAKSHKIRSHGSSGRHVRPSTDRKGIVAASSLHSTPACAKPSSAATDQKPALPNSFSLAQSAAAAGEAAAAAAGSKLTSCAAQCDPSLAFEEPMQMQRFKGQKKGWEMPDDGNGIALAALDAHRKKRRNWNMTGGSVT
jgi:hypothetical protein